METLKYLNNLWDKVDNNIKTLINLKFPEDKEHQFYLGYSEALKFLLAIMIDIKYFPKEMILIADATYLKTLIKLEQFKTLKETKVGYIN